jgi:hypothetical protein
MNQSPEQGPLPPPEAHTPERSPYTEPEVPGGELLPQDLPLEGLNVVRSSGDMDIGSWRIEGARKLIDDETGEEDVLVSVTAPAPKDSPHESLLKRVRLADLKQWNKPPEAQPMNPYNSENELQSTPQEPREVNSASVDNLGDEAERRAAGAGHAAAGDTLEGDERVSASQLDEVRAIAAGEAAARSDGSERDSFPELTAQVERDGALHGKDKDIVGWIARGITRNK